jgi:hypothetical protein
LVNPKTRIGVIRCNGRERHGSYVSLVGMLHQGRSATLFDLPQSGCPVTISAAQNDPDHSISVVLGGGSEQWIDRRTSVVDFRPPAQPDVLGFQKHVVVRWCHVHVPGFDGRAVMRKLCRKAIGSAQKLRQYARVAADVQDNED